MSSDSGIIKLAQNGLRTELIATEIYARLSKKYASQPIAGTLREFADAEKCHATFWRTFLQDRHVDPDTVRYSNIRVSVLVFIYGILGLGLSLKLLEANERRVIQLFSKATKTNLLTPKEMTETLNFLFEELLHEEQFLDYEVKYRRVINKIGTIFLQTSDGTVIVISTALGLAGVYTSAFWIGIVGFIVGFAATVDSILKTYLLNRTALGFKKDILGKLKQSCEIAPEAYQRRIVKYMKKKRYDEQTCKQIAALAKENNMIEDIIAEEEYGIAQQSLENPRRTALETGAFKIVGVVLPVVPFLIGNLSFAIPASIFIMVVLLFFLGSITALVAEVDIKKKVLQLTATGLLLSLLTFLVGKIPSILTASMNIR
jgi:predicted membrane protein (TIGR00267 family)